MKRMLLCTFAALCALCSYAQTRAFDRFADMDGVSSVYITKAMFEMMSETQVNGLDFKGMADKLESIQVYSSEKPSVIERMRNSAREINERNGYETLVRVNDDGESTNIYQKKFPDGLNEFIVLSSEKKEYTAIIITGRITQADLRHIVGQ